MNRLKDIWGGQDDMNRVLFLIAVAVFVWSLIEGHGMYGALMVRSPVGGGGPVPDGKPSRPASQAL
mgnify:CR=1 FL=1